MNRTRKYCVLGILSTLVLVPVVTLSACSRLQPTPPADNVGFVIHFTGSWFIKADGRKPKTLSAGDAVPAGATVLPDSTNDADDSLVITLYDGAIRTVTRDSPDSKMPARVDRNDHNRLLSAAGFWYRDRLVHAQSRAQIDCAPQDAVVALSDGTVNMSPVFEAMPAGQYVMDLQAGLSATTSEIITLRPLSWEPGQPLIVSANELAAGEYRFRLHDDEDPENDLQGLQSVILIASSAERARLSKAFQGAVEFTNRWPNDIPGNARRAFREAILHVLAVESTSRPLHD